MKRLEAPNCHWGSCPSSDKRMFLLNENDQFWFFAHGCGCTRAVTKPSQRATSMYHTYDNSVEQERKRQRYLESRPEFSFSSKLGVKQ